MVINLFTALAVGAGVGSIFAGAIAWRMAERSRKARAALESLNALRF